MKKIGLWFRVIRPQTLFASLCPVLIGLRVSPKVNGWIAGVTLCCALALQILSNLINDYYDFKRGADRVGRAGYRRALAEGEVTMSQVRTAILIVFGFALLLGLVLVIWAGTPSAGHFQVRGAIPILCIGLTALLFAWLYTATSHALSYLGIADLFVLLYYGMIASTGTTYLQTHTFSRASLYAGTVCGLLSMCVLMINNLRDIEGDALVGKRTFPVRFGKRAGEIGMLLVILLIPIFAYLAFGWCWAMLVVFPALGVFYLTLQAHGAQYNRCLLATGGVNLLYVLLALL